MSKVISLKLLSGEEVVAELIADRTQLLNEGNVSTVQKYLVRRPHILQFQPVGQGQIGLAFIPWTLSNPTIDEVEIPASFVIATFAPAAQVERQYLEQTSGLSLAPAGSINLKK